MNDLFKKAKALFGGSEQESRPAPAKKPVQPWHAVSIAPGPRACGAARGMTGRVFLSREAPALPLKDCDRPDCSCRYQHHDDRRKGARRAGEIGVTIEGYVAQERRAPVKRGRRGKDS